MTTPFYPDQLILPAWVSFLPTGGQNGGAGYQVDAQGGALVSCMYYAFPLIQTADISTEISMIYRSSLSASDNGYEGVTAQMRLLRVENNNLRVVWNNNVLVSGDQTKWFHENTGNEFVRHTIIESPPAGIAADFLDVCIIVKAPAGNVVFSNIEIRNRYERNYPVIIDGQGTKLPLDREIQTVTESIRLPFNRTITRQIYIFRSLWYLRTVPITVNNGERFVIEYDAALEALSLPSGGHDPDNFVAPVLSLIVKLKRKNAGQYDEFEVFKYIPAVDRTKQTTDLRVFRGTSSELIARYAYDQAELIIVCEPPLGTAENHQVNHQGVYVSVKTRGHEESG